MNELGQIQSWMLDRITQTQPSPKDLSISAILAPSANMTSESRLAIYQHAYYLRLMACFKAEYPVLLHLLGEELFVHLVVSYLKIHPSKSYTLQDLGAAFPTYLSKTYEIENDVDDHDELWPILIIELASIERTIMEVFNGQGSENKRLLNTDNDNQSFNLFSLSKDLKLTSSLRLFELHFDVVSYINAVRAGIVSDLPTFSLSFLACHRYRYQVKFNRLKAWQFHLLSELEAGNDMISILPRLKKKFSFEDQALETAVHSFIKEFANKGFFIE